MSLSHPIIQNITTFAQNYTSHHLRAVMMGGGLGYAIQNGFWHHTPLIILNPLAYNTYQVFVSQKDVIAWGKSIRANLM